MVPPLQLPLQQSLSTLHGSLLRPSVHSDGGGGGGGETETQLRSEPASAQMWDIAVAAFRHGEVETRPKWWRPTASPAVLVMGDPEEPPSLSHP